jgi:hypothetical protein
LKQLNLEKIKAALEKVPEEFEGLVAQIGFPSGQHYPDGTNVAFVASVHEFGAPGVNIPARPFMRPTVNTKKDSWVKTVKAGIPKVVTGQMSAFDVLDLVGIQGAADIQETISKVTSPPLSPITIARKGSAKPLIDTGQMFASVRNSVAPAGTDFTDKGSK